MWRAMPLEPGFCSTLWTARPKKRREQSWLMSGRRETHQFLPLSTRRSLKEKAKMIVQKELRQFCRTLSCSRAADTIDDPFAYLTVLHVEALIHRVCGEREDILASAMQREALYPQYFSGQKSKKSIGKLEIDIMHCDFRFLFEGTALCCSVFGLSSSILNSIGWTHDPKIQEILLWSMMEKWKLYKWMHLLAHYNLF